MYPIDQKVILNLNIISALNLTRAIVCLRIDLIISSMERTIGARKVTYDFERMMDGADLVSCSGFADEMIKRM